MLSPHRGDQTAHDLRGQSSWIKMHGYFLLLHVRQLSCRPYFHSNLGWRSIIDLEVRSRMLGRLSIAADLVTVYTLYGTPELNLKIVTLGY